MVMQRCFASAIVATLFVVASALADSGTVVGTVAELDPSVEESLSDKRVTVAEVGKPVYAGSRLVTKNPGRLFVNFEDRWAAKLWENSELWLTTNIRTEDGFAYKHQLRFGQIRVLIKEGQHVSVAIKTDAGTAIPWTTDFIVKYDGRTMTVVCLHGEVTFDSNPPRRDRRVTVKANEISTVARGKAPTSPQPADPQTLQQYAGGAGLIGGGNLESQAIDHPSLSTAVSPLVGREPFEGPYVPGERYPVFDPSPSDKLQPMFVPLGGVGIRF